MTYNKYSTKMRDVISKVNDAEFSKISDVYAGILESGNYKSDIGVVKDYLKVVSEMKSLNKKQKNVILNEFRDVTLTDLGVLETYENIIQDYEFVNESFYSERLDMVKQMIDGKPDYQIIEKVVDIYKTLNSDEVIEKQISKLEEQIQQYGEDIRVFNMIEWLTTWEDYKKYKKTIDTCIEDLKNYSLNPNSETRAVAVESLREIGYNPNVKEFINYLVAKNLSDPTYNLQKELPGSMATDRTYTGGYLEEWFTGKVKHGLGKIVQESLEDGYKLIKENNVPERTVVKLLLERLSNVKSNNIDKKFIKGLRNLASTYDLGLENSLKEIRRNSVIAKTPQFKKFENLVSINIQAGTPDKKIINEAYTILQQMAFDDVVKNQLDILSSNYEKVKDRIVTENFIEYLDNNNRLGLYESLKNDILEYLDNSTELLKEHIYNKHSKTAVDGNIKDFLNYLNSQTPNKNKLVNTNPKEFTINKVYGLYEKLSNGEHFVIDGSYLIKNNKGLNIAKESDKDPQVKNLFETLQSLNVRIDEGVVSGFVNKDKFSVKVNEDNKKVEMYINDSLFEKTNVSMFQQYYISNRNMDGINKYMSIYENFDMFTEFDNVANQIVYSKNPGVRVNIINMDGVYHINLINENIKLNKWVKTAKYETLKSKLMEFMGFDVSESFGENKLIVDKNEIDLLKESANAKHLEIMEAEKEMERLSEKINLLTDEIIKSEGWLVYESFNDNLNVLKSEYRNIVNKLMDLEK